ncbi:MAG: response regulator [Patescibacteria group bacterium]
MILSNMNERKKKILIVEDDEDISRIYDIKFSHEGYDTILAKSGEEVLEKILNERPDLIMLDLMLPKKDGFMVIEEIKKNQEVKNTPILVISNLGQKSDEDRVIALGANGYIVKVRCSTQEVVDKAKSFLQ